MDPRRPRGPVPSGAGWTFRPNRPTPNGDNDRVNGLGLTQVRTAYRSPWQNPFAGSVVAARRVTVQQIGEKLVTTKSIFPFRRGFNNQNAITINATGDPEVSLTWLDSKKGRLTMEHDRIILMGICGEPIEVPFESIRGSLLLTAKAGKFELSFAKTRPARFQAASRLLSESLAYNQRCQ